jgi:hypothetical protein
MKLVQMKKWLYVLHPVDLNGQCIRHVYRVYTIRPLVVTYTNNFN